MPSTPFVSGWARWPGCTATLRVPHRPDARRCRLARTPRRPTWPSSSSATACRSASAHAIVGAAGAPLARRRDCRWRDLVRAEPPLGPDAAQLLDPGVSVRQRTTPGGAGPVAVAVQRRRLGARCSGSVHGGRRGDDA